MNELKAHERYVLSRPTDRTAALALVDHVQETAGCERMSALRTVARILFLKRKARRLAVAAKWLAHRADIGSYLRREILRRVQRPLSSNALRVLVDGFHPPRMTLQVVGGPVRTRNRAVILVSAGWVVLRVAYWFNSTCNRPAMLQAKRGP